MSFVRVFFQLRVTFSPDLMVVSDALSVQRGELEPPPPPPSLSILTEAWQLVVPVPFVAVSTNVVLALTVSVRVPSDETLPMFWLIDTFVAFVVAQVSVTEAPLFTEFGLTVNASQLGTTTSGTIFTATVQVFVSVPRVAVSVKVVFLSTNTDSVPSTVTMPTPLSMETLAAFDVAHVSVVVPAVFRVAGAAVKASHVIGSGSGSTVTVFTHFAVPPSPIAVSV
jgi:hypothetical protein